MRSLQVLTALGLSLSPALGQEGVIRLLCEGDYRSARGDLAILKKTWGMQPSERKKIALQLNGSVLQQLDHDTFQGHSCKWDHQTVFCYGQPSSHNFAKVEYLALLNRWTGSASLGSKSWIDNTSGFYFSFDGTCIPITDKMF